MIHVWSLKVRNASLNIYSFLNTRQCIERFFFFVEQNLCINELENRQRSQYSTLVGHRTLLQVSEVIAYNAISLSFSSTQTEVRQS